MRPPRLIATTLLALIWLGGALAVLQVVLSAGVPSEGAASLIAHASGMAAGYGAAIMLILMSRSPWLERGVGTHRLARWHGWGGQLVIILAVVHALHGSRGVGGGRADRVGWRRPGTCSTFRGSAPP